MAFNNSKRGLSKEDLALIKSQREVGLKNYQKGVIALKEQIKQAQTELQQLSTTNEKLKQDCYKSIRAREEKAELELFTIKTKVANAEAKIKSYAGVVGNLESKIKAQSEQLVTNQNELNEIKEMNRVETEDFNIEEEKLFEDQEKLTESIMDHNKNIKEFEREKLVKTKGFEEIRLAQKQRSNELDLKIEKFEVQKIYLKTDLEELNRQKCILEIRLEGAGELEKKKHELELATALFKKSEKINKQWAGALSQKENEQKILGINLRRKDSDLDKRDKNLKKAEAAIGA